MSSTSADLTEDQEIGTNADPNRIERSTPKEWEADDEKFDVLSNHRRRQVLRYLDEDMQATVGELAEHIAAIENDKPIAALSSQERKRVYIALYQSHLPKMAAADIVTYDKNRGTVSPTENATELRALLEEPRPPRRWSGYYLANTGIIVIGLALGATVLGVAVSSVAVFGLAGYVLLATIHATAEYVGPAWNVATDPREWL